MARRGAIVRLADGVVTNIAVFPDEDFQWQPAEGHVLVEDKGKAEIGGTCVADVFYPAPPPPPPPPPPTAQEKLKALGLTVDELKELLAT